MSNTLPIVVMACTGILLAVTFKLMFEKAEESKAFSNYVQENNCKETGRIKDAQIIPIINKVGSVSVTNYVMKDLVTYTCNNDKTIQRYQ